MLDTENASNALLHFFRKKNYKVSYTNFKFRLVSHPKYPGLESVADTFTYFKIPHDWYQVAFGDIDETPDEYLAYLQDPYKQQSLHHIKRKKGVYYVDSKRTDLARLEKRWKGIVLLLPKEGLRRKNIFKEKNKFFLGILLVALVIFGLYKTGGTVWTYLFAIFSLLGFVLSAVAQKKVLKLNTSFFDKFCGGGSRTSCDTLASSKSAYLFRKISFSDISFIFFTVQLVTFMVLSALGFESSFFSIQKILVLGSIPFIIVSIYIQKVIEKIWCPICLNISAILVLEVIYILMVMEGHLFLNKEAIVLFIVSSGFIASGWYYTKEFLIRVNKSKEKEIRLTRFIRNYSTFKQALLKEKKYDFPKNSSKGLRTENKLSITLLTDPFCEYCSKAHQVFEQIAEKNKDTIDFNILFKIDIEDEEGNDKLLCQRLAEIQINNNENELLKALGDWFLKENISEWLQKYKHPINEIEADNYLLKQYKWCLDNKLNYTPAVFINTYHYPLIYDTEHLDYFIQDLVNDTDFLSGKAF